MTDNSPVEIGSARDLVHAHILVALLKGHGIEAHVRNESLQGVLGAVPMDITTAPQLVVAASDADEAMQILDDYESKDEGESSS